WPSTEELSAQQQKDLRFFSIAISGSELTHRVSFAVEEVWRIADQVTIIGHGVGTSGILRNLLPRRDPDVPITLDAGLSLIVVEVGLIGTAIFSVLIVWLHARSFPRQVLPGLLDPVQSACWISALCLTGWFLLKSHSILENAFAQMLWFGC